MLTLVSSLNHERTFGNLNFMNWNIFPCCVCHLVSNFSTCFLCHLVSNFCLFSLLFSEHIKDLLIVLVFSLATTLSAVHNALPHAVSTRLHIEVFHAEPSLQCLHEILNKVTYVYSNILSIIQSATSENCVICSSRSLFHIDKSLQFCYFELVFQTFQISTFFNLYTTSI